MNYITNFFTCCNDKYSDFAPLFAYSHLMNNPNCVVEIGFESEISIKKNKESFNFIQKIFPKKFFYSIVPFHFTIENKKYVPIPNTIRFMVQPKVKAQYVYISDIDIVCLEKNISDIHINNMKKNDIPYSNMVRKYDTPQKYKRLTGLHFTKWNSYYPIPEYKSLAAKGLLNHDEVFLYELVSLKNKINESLDYRPVHGIHISPNRNPDSWGIKKWVNDWKIFRKEPTFLKLETYFSKKLSNNIKKIDNY